MENDDPVKYYDYRIYARKCIFYKMQISLPILTHSLTRTGA